MMPDLVMRRGPPPAANPKRPSAAACGAPDAQIPAHGQYLSPSALHRPVACFYHPDEFAELAERGRELGFANVESGPLGRASYHAKKQTDAAVK